MAITTKSSALDLATFLSILRDIVTSDMWNFNYREYVYVDQYTNEIHVNTKFTHGNHTYKARFIIDEQGCRVDNVTYKNYSKKSLKKAADARFMTRKQYTLTMKTEMIEKLKLAIDDIVNLIV